MIQLQPPIVRSTSQHSQDSANFRLIYDINKWSARDKNPCYLSLLLFLSSIGSDIDTIRLNSISILFHVDSQDMQFVFLLKKKSINVSEEKNKTNMQLMIYEGLFKLSTDSMDMIDDILNGECVCAVHAFFRLIV